MGNKGRRGGAQPGGGRPSLWIYPNGEKPHLSCLRVPDDVAKQTLLAAIMLDKKDPRIIAFFSSLESLEQDKTMEKY